MNNDIFLNQSRFSKEKIFELAQKDSIVNYFLSRYQEGELIWEQILIGLVEHLFYCNKALESRVKEQGNSGDRLE